MLTKCRYPLLFHCIILLFCPQDLGAQEVILPTYSGQELLDSLVVQYKPVINFTYAQARDTLYRKILAQQDSLSCIYTGYTVYLDPTQDPSVAAFAQGINAEHIYPRSKGADEELPSADMYNLFASREDINADRGDLGFGEIPDAQTLSWYYSDRHQSTIPTSNIDAYSELGNDRFEPRESVKGDIARAVFYFYTMYQPEADLADPTFFQLQKSTLCDWQVQDPVDQQEWDRNQAIANYQNHRPNPYILDCTLAYRAFCPDNSIPACEFTRADDISTFASTAVIYPAFPNPFTTDITLKYKLLEKTRVKITLVDGLGRPISTWTDTQQAPGEYRRTFRLEAIPPGVYFLQISAWSGDQIRSQGLRVIKR